MATKTAKTRNPDRKNGKAWAKNHTATVKVLSTEAQMRKAEKEVRRGKRPPQDKPGSNITMPRITWRWAEEIMADRWPNTKRLRMFDAVLAEERRGGPSTEAPSVIESNPEVKSRKNGR